MQSSQEAKLNMYNAVISYCDQNNTIIDSIHALTTSYALFKRTVVSITDTAQLESKSILGFATDKNSVRKTLAQKAAALASKISAYANSVNDNVLKETVKFTLSELLRLKDEELPSACRNILQAANSHLVPLAAYNIDAPLLTAFTAKITEYTSWVPRPRIAASQRAAHLLTLAELFKTADDILKNQVDKIIADFKLSNAPFYKPYSSNRTIVNARTTATQIKGTIINDTTNQPVEDATIFIEETIITTSTGKKGKYTLKPVPPGVHSFNVSKQGYHEKTITDQIIRLGQVTTINIALTPAV